MKYFDQFPRIPYQISNDKYGNYQEVTNILFRIGIIRNIISNIGAYYVHRISDSETPEILAESIYGDPEGHWVILIPNNIIDPFYNWPLNDRDFNKYISDKYGSISNAKSTIHHYEKVITREESLSGKITETKFIINQERLTDDAIDEPHDYYEGEGSLPETQEVNTYNMGSGKTVIEIIRRNSVSNYDYENSLNESRREIKIIKPEYYGQIINEFNTLTRPSGLPYYKKVV